MTDGVAPPAPSYSANTADALADMRSSAKWLLGAFAATGAVIFAGVQLTSLGDVNNSTEAWRIPTAMAGFGITIVGIAVAIGAIGTFLRRSPLTAKDLATNGGSEFQKARDSLFRDPTILGTYDSVEDVWDAYRDRVSKLSETPTAALGEQADALNRILGNALTRASLVMTSARYRSTLWRVAIGAIIAAVGAGAFAVASAQPKNAQAQLPTLVRPATAVSVTIRAKSPNRTALRKLLGARCDTHSLNAVVLEQTAASTFVLAVPATNECKASEITVNARDAVVSLPAPSSS